MIIVGRVQLGLIQLPENPLYPLYSEKYGAQRTQRKHKGHKGIRPFQDTNMKDISAPAFF